MRKRKSKVTNWHQSFPEFWINSETRQILRVLRIRQNRIKYLIKIEDRNRNESITLAQDFEEKTNAIKYAWEWMIEHPEGITFEGGN